MDYTDALPEAGMLILPVTAWLMLLLSVNLWYQKEFKRIGSTHKNRFKADGL